VPTGRLAVSTKPLYLRHSALYDVRAVVITIRQQQLKALRAASREEFVRQVAEHVRECWPDAHASLGVAGMRQYVRAAIDRAEAYGISTQYGVVGFVDLLLALGDDFDTNDAFPWAREILTRDVPAREKIDTLELYAREVLGENGHA
jgi:hypothetical protein